MAEARWRFGERDLLFLIDFFMPGRTDKRGMVHVLQEDEDILQSMVQDPSLSEALQVETEPVIQVSPYLHFAVLLHQAREDLRSKPYTFEKDTRRMMVIFDTKRIRDLLSKKSTMIYLATMLASFTKIHSYTIMTRVRKGIWRRTRFSDFDVESLISYSETAEAEFLFPVYKRIADICLFTMGVYAFASSDEELQQSQRRRRRRDFRKCGPHFYLTAAKHREAAARDMRETLIELAESFDLAIKPLAFMADHYIGSLRTKVFSLPESSTP